MNNKGFTLVELLGTMVILGICLTIAIPAATRYIDKSKRESFSTVIHEYSDAVGKSIASGEYEAPIDRNDLTIISLDLIPLDKGKKESSFDSEWVKSKSYIIVVNTGTRDNPTYSYYAAAQDENNHAISLTETKGISSKKVISDAKNKMEVTIQSLCGSPDGKKLSLSILKGLESIQPVDDGNVLDWDATIYSSLDCGVNK